MICDLPYEEHFEPYKCTICCVYRENDDKIKMECGKKDEDHYCCQSCLDKNIEYQFGKRLDKFLCICGSDFDEGFIEKNLGPDGYKTLLKYRLYKKIESSDNLLHCLNSKCEKEVEIPTDGSRVATCKHCQTKICVRCQRFDHPGRGC